MNYRAVVIDAVTMQLNQLAVVGIKPKAIVLGESERDAMLEGTAPASEAFEWLGIPVRIEGRVGVRVIQKEDGEPVTPV